MIPKRETQPSLTALFRDVRLKLLKILVRRKAPRVLAASTALSIYSLNHSPRRVNKLLQLTAGRRRYLEIGVHRGKTIEGVEALQKIGVDPFPDFNLDQLPANLEIAVKTSRDFFTSFQGDKFNLVFVDGLHEAREAYLDVIDSLNCLDEGGLILLDDVSPMDEWSALPDKGDSIEALRIRGITHGKWYGDVWKVAAVILNNYPSLGLIYLGRGAEDHGQAVIFRIAGNEEKFLAKDEDFQFMKSLSFQDYVNLRDGALATITFPEDEGIRQIARLLEKI